MFKFYKNSEMGNYVFYMCHFRRYSFYGQLEGYSVKRVSLLWTPPRQTLVDNFIRIWEELVYYKEITSAKCECKQEGKTYFNDAKPNFSKHSEQKKVDLFTSWFNHQPRSLCRAYGCWRLAGPWEGSDPLCVALGHHSPTTSSHPSWVLCLPRVSCIVPWCF